MALSSGGTGGRARMDDMLGLSAVKAALLWGQRDYDVTILGTSQLRFAESNVFHQ